MRAVVTSGTGAGLGFGPNVYAKTGTADIQGQDQPNSWMVAFDTSKDVAVACLVVNAGYGAQFAGPEAASFLKGLDATAAKAPAHKDVPEAAVRPPAHP